MIFSPSHATQILPGTMPVPKSPSMYSRSSGSGSDTAIRRPVISRNPSVADFQVEKVPRIVSKKSMPTFETVMDPATLALKSSVNTLMAAKRRLFTASGRIPLDPTHLNLFFRSKSGITHSLDFPIDPMFNTPPALDVLIAACRPHPAADDVDDFVDRESLFYPPNLPLTATLELSNHPILDAIRSTLFPSLPRGHYLTTVRDKLEVLVDGGRMAPQPRELRTDGRIATVMVVLPVRFRGGALIIRDIDGNEEKFSGRGGKSGDMEWVAFTADSEYEVETVHKGCRLSISYGVFLKTFGPAGMDPLIHPSDAFLDKVAPVLNMMRGQKIAFHLTSDYDINPSEVLAESIVPFLKGGDSVLYHALKLYKLSPELHYTAGGYIWPVDTIVNLLQEGESAMAHSISSLPPQGRAPLTTLNGSPNRRMVAQRALMSPNSVYGTLPDEDLRSVVEESGGIPLSEEGITMLTDQKESGVGKLKVMASVNGELERVTIYVLMAHAAASWPTYVKKTGFSELFEVTEAVPLWMNISLSELLSSRSNNFILFSTLVVVISTTLAFLALGFGIVSMFRRGGSGHSNTTSGTSTAAGSPPVRKSSWGLSTGAGSATGRVKAAVKELNTSPSQPSRKNSLGLASVRGGSRPTTPSSTKSGTTASVASKAEKPKESPALQTMKKSMEEKIAELTSQISAVRAEVQEREQKLSLSTHEVDTAKDRLSVVTKEVAELRSANGQLSAENDARQKELLSLKASHDRLRSLYSASSRALEDRSSELASERSKLETLGLPSYQDKLSCDDVVSLLRTLNDNIRDLAAFMADQFDLAAGLQKGAADFTSEDMEEAKDRAEEILGSKMVQLLMHNSKHRKANLDSLVRLAFQAGLSAYGEWMVTSWMFEDPGKEGVLNSIYESMRKTESSTLLGIWKSVTRKHGQKATSVAISDLSIYFLDALINVLIVSGFRATHMSLHSHITVTYPDKINRLVQDATRLNKSVGEDVTTYDLELVHIPPGTKFDPVFMDAFGTSTPHGKNGKGKKGKEEVLCTLDLGLLRLVKNPATGIWENRLLVKPKVVLQSSLESRRS